MLMLRSKPTAQEPHFSAKPDSHLRNALLCLMHQLLHCSLALQAKSNDLADSTSADLLCWRIALLRSLPPFPSGCS